MAFLTDPRIPAANGDFLGEYLMTFRSERGEVQADLFRRGKTVTAHVWFPTGLNAGNVNDSYYTELMDYARDHGFADKFSLIYSY